MGETEKNFLMEMLLTGVHGLDWPKVTYLKVIIKDKDKSVIFKKNYDSSDHKGHVEEKMLSDPKFLQIVESDDDGGKAKTGKVYIILTMNYSPCWKCAPKLITFYNDNKSSVQKLTIRFAHPYTDKKESVTCNENGLKDLNKELITLEAMDDDSWNEAGVRFEELNKDPEWKENIRAKIWLYKKRFNNITLEEVKLSPNWKEKIKEAIHERDKQTEVYLKKLLLASPAPQQDFEELAKLTKKMSLKS